MVHYLAPPEAMAAMAETTPEEKMAGMKPWMDWKESMGNQVIDFGAPVMGATRINPNGSTEKNPSQVTGYSILEAESGEALMEKLKSHPHLQWREDVAIEIYECIPM